MRKNTFFFISKIDFVSKIIQKIFDRRLYHIFDQNPTWRACVSMHTCIFFKIQELQSHGIFLTLSEGVKRRFGGFDTKYRGPLNICIGKYRRLIVASPYETNSLWSSTINSFRNVGICPCSYTRKLLCITIIPCKPFRVRISRICLRTGVKKLQKARNSSNQIIIIQ